MNNKDDNRSGELEILKIHLDSLKTFLVSKSEAVLMLSSISLGLLVVASFNEKLLPVTSSLRIIICFLLILTPVALLFFLIEITQAINNAQKSIEHISKSKINLLQNKSFIFKCGHHIIFLFPYFGALVLTIIMVYIATIIWPSTLSNKNGSIILNSDKVLQQDFVSDYFPIPGEVGQSLHSPNGKYSVVVEYTEQLGSRTKLKAVGLEKYFDGVRPVSFSLDSNFLFVCKYDQTIGRAIPAVINIESKKIQNLTPVDLPGFPPIRSNEDCPSDQDTNIKWQGLKINYSLPDSSTTSERRYYEADLEKMNFYRINK